MAFFRLFHEHFLCEIPIHFFKYDIRLNGFWQFSTVLTVNNGHLIMDGNFLCEISTQFHQIHLKTHKHFIANMTLNSTVFDNF